MLWDANIIPLKAAEIAAFCVRLLITPLRLLTLAGHATPIADHPPTPTSTTSMGPPQHPDYKFTPPGSRGIGEIGITGAAAAISNAVYNATGKRVRDLPITLDKFMHA